MNTTNAIEINNLTKKYEGFTLDQISFQVPYGSIVGFVGENGAGKSTTIKAILGLIQCESGSAQMLGYKMGEKNPAWKEEIGVVFDECNFPLELKIPHIRKMLQNIYITWDNNKFQNYLERFELPENKKIKEFSKGMKMKLSIAAALSHNSRLLILDEATSGLDPIIRNEILDIFREFIEDEGHAILISSHITSDIEKISDYIVMIHKGKIIFAESKDELIYNYGLVKCTAEQIKQIPDAIIMGVDQGTYESRVLVNDKSIPEKYGFIVDRVSIEDIMLYSVKSNSKG